MHALETCTLFPKSKTFFWSTVSAQEVESDMTIQWVIHIATLTAIGLTCIIIIHTRNITLQSLTSLPALTRADALQASDILNGLISYDR